MPLETATTLSELNSAWPDLDDDLIEGDDHIRLLKSVLKTQFPGAGGAGFVGSILTYASEFNHLVGLVSNLQQQLDNIDTNNVQIGGVIMYSGTVANIPANYRIADGSGGTFNLSKKFIRGTTTVGNIGITGGNDITQTLEHNHSLVHTHGGTLPNAGSHTHEVPKDSDTRFTRGNKFLGVAPDYPDGAGGYWDTSSVYSKNETHDHILTVTSSPESTDLAGTADTGTNLPPFYTLLFIQRMS